MASDVPPPSSSKLPWWLAAFAAVGGLVFLGLPHVSEGSKSKPQAQIAAEKPKEDEVKGEDPAAFGRNHPFMVLRDFFRLTPEQEVAASEPKFRVRFEQDGLSWGPESVSPRQTWNLANYINHIPGVQYESLIVTIPDPVETRFAVEFDAMIEAIQRAYEARGFTIHSSWLPWPRANKPSSKPGQYRNYPGVLLFHRESTVDEKRTHQLALVWLVGESPISGLHPLAFSRALTFHHGLDITIATLALRPAGAPADWRPPVWRSDNKILIAGPAFSGSLPMMVAALKEWRDQSAWYIGKRDRYAIRVISGSATAIDPSVYSCHALGERGLSNVSIQSTVIPNVLTSQAVLHYLADNRAARLPTEKPSLSPRVAILREANTGFGAEVNPSKRADEQEEILDLPFPVSISQLAAATERDAAAPPRTEFIEPRLPLRDQLPLDGVPPYDRESAATISGETLRTLFTTIERERVSYVGIVATDTRDVVFLNRLLRKECPHVRVFMTEPGIALLHPDEAYHLRGMVVGSTYPLHAGATAWTTPKTDPKALVDQRILFPTQASQGYYNAILALCGDYRLMIGYRSPDFHGPTNSFLPPIWISVIGQSGSLLPVHCYVDYEDNRAAVMYHPPKPIQSPSLHIKFPTGFLAAQIAALILIWCAVAVVSYRPWWRAIAAGRSEKEAVWLSPIGRARVGPVSGAWLWRSFLLNAVLLFALPYSFPVIEWYSPSFDSPGGQSGRLNDLTLNLALFIGIGAVALLVPLVWRTFEKEARWDESPFLFGFLALSTILLIVALWGSWCILDPTARFFLYVRTFDFAAGMSPLVPMALFAAAAFAVGWFMLRQADDARRSWIACPYDYPWSRVQKADEELDACCQDPVRSMWNDGPTFPLLVVGLPLFGAFVWHVFVVPLPSGEGSRWDWGMRGVFGMVGLVVTFALVRFLTVWNGLRELLLRILRVPMLGAFERIPDEIGHVFGGYLYSRRPKIGHLAAAAWTLPVPDREALAEEINKSHPDLLWVFGHPRPETNPEVEQSPAQEERSKHRLAGELEYRAEKWLKELPKAWEGQSVEQAFGVHGAKEEKADAPDQKTEPAIQLYPPPTGVENPSWVRDAERFVACLVVLYLGRYFTQLRQLAFAFAVPAPLLLFAAASYPFQPDRPRLDAMLGLVIAAAVAVVFVLYRINCDGLISRITRTTPNRFTPDSSFLSSVVTYALPLLAVLLAHVFGLFRFILEPVYRLFS